MVEVGNRFPTLADLNQDVIFVYTTVSWNRSLFF